MAGILEIEFDGRFQIGRSLGIFSFAEPGHAAYAPIFRPFRLQPNGFVEPDEGRIIVAPPERPLGLLEGPLGLLIALGRRGQNNASDAHGHNGD